MLTPKESGYKFVDNICVRRMKQRQQRSHFIADITFANMYKVVKSENVNVHI